MLKLYDFEDSGNAYKARLLLALLNLPYEKVQVELFKGEHKQPPFLKLNPRGQVPVLADGDYVVWDSLAVLVYLARKHGGESWLPTDAEAMGEVMQWMAVSENELLYGAGRARVINKFGFPGNLDAAQSMARGILDVMERHLTTRDWLACAHSTIADVACFPYTALIPDGGIPLDPYPGIRAWIARVKSLPGFVPMPGID